MFNCSGFFLWCSPVTFCCDVFVFSAVLSDVSPTFFPCCFHLPNSEPFVRFCDFVVPRFLKPERVVSGRPPGANHRKRFELIYLGLFAKWVLFRRSFQFLFIFPYFYLFFSSCHCSNTSLLRVLVSSVNYTAPAILRILL